MPLSALGVAATTVSTSASTPAVCTGICPSCASVIPFLTLTGRIGTNRAESDDGFPPPQVTSP